MKKTSRASSYIPGTDQSPAPRRKAKIAIIVLFLLIALALSFAFGAFRYLDNTFEADGPLEAETVFTVPRGSGVSAIAAKLENEGFIRSADMFKLMIKIEGQDSGLKAGEFAVKDGASLRDIYETLTDGKAILYPFTVPEGRTSAQIIRSMTSLETLIDDEPEIPAEGTLLPETYHTPRGMKRSALIKKMADAQTEFVDRVWQHRADNLPIKTKEEAIILASVVEKETGIGSERDMVAGVFVNRLNRGMRLESDPTIIYGISQGDPLGRGIRRSEIKRKTDWNTYQMDGLPKTPICNPGKDAILAVLNPGKTDAIFFVADGTGGHAFAKTLAGHNANVKKWRAIERKRKAGR